MDFEEQLLDYSVVVYVMLLQDMPRSHLELITLAKDLLEVAEGLQKELVVKNKDAKNGIPVMDRKLFVVDEA